MTTLIIKTNQKPTPETIARLSNIKDEDIVYDEDSPRLTPVMEAAIENVIKQNKLKKVN